MAEFFGRIKPFFIQNICQADANARQCRQRVVAVLHGLAVSRFTGDIKTPLGQL